MAVTLACFIGGRFFYPLFQSVTAMANMPTVLAALSAAETITISGAATVLLAAL